jgi:hypothetical protein
MPEWDSQNGTARTGQPERDDQNGTARTRQPDSGQPEWDRQEQDRQNRECDTKYKGKCRLAVVIILEVADSLL